jgi:hypothetical protein
MISPDKRPLHAFVRPERPHRVKYFVGEGLHVLEPRHDVTEELRLGLEARIVEAHAQGVWRSQSLGML